MKTIHRQVQALLQKLIVKRQSVLLLGPRQTGKTTLIRSLPVDISLNLLDPSTRQYYEQQPGRLKQELQSLDKVPLVFIDEVQKVPALLDVVQDCIDSHLAYFILTGSSARKLRHHQVNLLPGRLISLYLDPLSLAEYPRQELLEALTDGSLPGMVLEQDLSVRELHLRSYVVSYLEEEVRAEALVRNVAAFSRFLELAAAESGQIVNLTKLSQEIGVSHNTISEYYQILQDTLITERIDPFLSSKTRRQIVKSPKYLFFDLGVRRLAAREGKNLPITVLGRLFEQWVGLSLIRVLRNLPQRPQLYFWRDKDGIEVDYVLKNGSQLIPIEVKYSREIQESDIKHLKIFMREFNVPQAYVIAQVPQALQLTENIKVYPWQNMVEILKTFI